MSDKELISALLKQNAELQISNNEFQSQFTAFKQEILDLKAELAWYKSGRNSHNSHLPPSRDIYKPTPPKPKRKKSKRNPGGQHGHKASRLEKTESPDVVVVHEVSTCQHCDINIREQSSEVLRTAQVFDIPRIELKVTENHKVRKCCPECGRHTTSELPGTHDYIDAQ